MIYKLRPLIVVANFHYDEKRVQENPKMPKCLTL